MYSDCKQIDLQLGAYESDELRESARSRSRSTCVHLSDRKLGAQATAVHRGGLALGERHRLGFGLRQRQLALALSDVR